MSNEFIVKNGLIVGGNVVTSGTITINGALAATQSWVASQGYLTSASLSGYATQSYVTSAISSLIDAAPAALDTLNELAAALGDDANFSTTITNSIASKLSLTGGTLTGALNGTSASFSSNVTLGNNADLVFVDLAGTFPTTGKGFDWTLNNDGARIYAVQPGSDSIDLVFQLRDNATTNDRFVFWVDEWQGPAYDKYPLIISGGTEFDLKDSSLYTNTVLRLSNSGVLQNVTGNISMFTNNAGYLTSYTETDTLATVTGRGATTNTSITVGHDLTVQADGGSGYTASRLWLNSHNNYRGAGVHMSGTGSTWFAGTPYTDFDGGYVIARTGTSNDQASAQYSNALLTVKSSGNIGIGTTAPTHRLTVAGGNVLMFPSDNTRQLSFFSDSYGITASSGLELITGDYIRFRQGSTELARLTTTGLGIGTTSPSAKIHIVPTGTQVGLIADGTSVTAATANKVLDVLYNGGSSAFSVRSNGLVYIGYDSMYVEGAGITRRYWDSRIQFGTADLSSSTTGANVEVYGGLKVFRNVSNSSTPEIFRITNGGNVGIKVANPTATLSLGTSSYDNNPLTGLEYSQVTGGGRLDLKVQTWGTGSDYGLTTGLTIVTPGFDTNNVRVGIGTASPATPLHVTGGASGSGGWNRTATLAATYPGLIFNSNGTKWGGMAYDYSAAMRFWVNANNDDIFAGTLAMSILNNGNVGIGTSDPIYKLQVAGSAYVNGGTLFIDSGQYLRWGNSNQGIVGVNDSYVAIVSGGTTRQTIYAEGRTYFPGLDLSISNVNGSHGSGTYFRGDGGHFVFGLSSGNTLYLNYGNSAGILRTFGTWYHESTQILSTSRVLTNVSGNISMFTNDAGYLTSVSDVWVNTTGDTMTGDLTLNYGYPRINFYDSNHDSDYSLINNDGGFSLYDITNNLHRWWVSPSGNMGIGTTSPANKLVVTSDASPTSENSYSIAAASASDPAYKTVIGYDYSNDIGLIAAVRTGIGWRNLSIPQGSLGIGTTSPGTKLHVVGNAWINRPSNKVDNAGCTELPSRVEFNNAFASGQSGYMIFRYPTYNNFLISGDYDGNIGGAIPNIQFGRQSTVYMHINSSDGNIGIGTTSPSEKLHVEGTTDVNILVRTSGASGNAYTTYENSGDNTFAWAIGRHNAGGFYFNSSTGGTYPSGTTTTRMVIDTSGNVGIGTSSPSEKLHVSGAAVFDGGSGNSSTDAVVYITKSNNNDWGLYVNAAALDYGMYTRVSPSAGYAIAVNNGTSWTTRITGDGRIYLNEKDTIASYDTWLRLNESGHYGSGVFTPGVMRADGGFQVSGNTVIHSGTIGSQSVSYANNAGYAAEAGQVINQSGQLLRFDNRIISPSETTAGYLQFGFTSWGNDNSSPYADYLHMRSYTDGSGGNDNLVMFLKSGIGMRIYQQTFGSATAYSSYADVWTSANFTSTNVSNWNTAYGWGNHASSGYLTSYSETDTLQSVTSRGNSTYDRINVRGIGNQGGGNIMMGNVGEGTNKWSYLTSTHYNASSQPQGFALIGGLATSGGNAVVIGGNIYETNPATEIQFWTHGTNTHNLGGTQRGVINSAGNWGIGTSTPSKLLEVAGDIMAGTSNKIGFRYSGGDSNFYNYITANNANPLTLVGGMWTATGATEGIRFATYNGAALSILNNGNVGIGTTSPSAKLEIAGFSTGAGLKLNYGNSSGTIEAVNFIANGGANGVIGMQMVSAGVGDLWLGGSGGRTLTLYRDGNVGIGVTTPQKKLDVFGSAGIVASIGASIGVGQFAGLHFGYSESYVNNDSYKKSALVFERTESHGQGSNASGKIHFLLNNISGTSANALTDSVVTIDSDASATVGSVRMGIGTRNPSYPLDVNGTSRFSQLAYYDAYESMNFYGARGRFTNEYIHLYNKVGVGHPGGWGQGETSTPNHGLSTYGGANFAYGNNADSTFNGIVYSTASFRAPIFYDSNDTNYYGDFAGTSRFNNLYIEGAVASVYNASGYASAAIEVRERNFGGAQDDTFATAPRIGFHWAGRVAAQIAIASNGRIHILNDPGTLNEGFQAGIIYSSGYGDSTQWNTAYSWGNHASASYATTSYVTTQINNLIAGAPGVLDTLDELAAALGDDSNFATTVTNSIAAKLPLAGGNMTGSIGMGAGANIAFTGGSHAIYGNNTGYLHFYDYTDVYFNNQLVIRGGIRNDNGNVLIDDNLNLSGELAFPDGGGAYSNIIRAAAYPTEGFPTGSNYWMEYRAKGGHHFILNTDGGVGGGANTMDDFVVWQGAIDGNRLLEVSNTGNLWIAGALTEASSIKLKENVETSEGNLEKVVNLRPVTYNKIGSQTKELGLIAEEVATVYPEFVQYDESGEPVGVNYSRLTAALIGAVKELSSEVKELKKQING